MGPACRLYPHAGALVAVRLSRCAHQGYWGTRMSDATLGHAIIRHLMIRGRVQGVGFRAWIEYTALERGLEGWVRNRRDGAVEAVIAGPAAAVAAMIEACRQGPPGARVDA